MTAPALAVVDVSKNFGAVRAVQDVSFTAEKAALTCLIGPNGAGKSTLLRCICGVYRPDSGQIRLEGQDISAMRSDRRARAGVATVTQGTGTLNQLDLLHNVMLGAHRWTRAGFLASSFRLPPFGHDERRAREAALRSLKRVGLGDWADAPVDGLPFGRLRLLAVARALTQDPTVLLLDEPAAGLRDAEKQSLVEVFRRLRDEGLTQVLVEHDMNFVNALADRVVVLDHGALIADDTPEAVRRDKRVQAAYLGLEATA